MATTTTVKAIREPFLNKLLGSFGRFQRGNHSPLNFFSLDLGRPKTEKTFVERERRGDKGPMMDIFNKKKNKWYYVNPYRTDIQRIT